jgi:PEP-CTERM motif
MDKAYLLGRCGAVVSMLAVSTSLSAAPVTFFGQDVSAGGSLPIPNSVAAQTQFLSNIIGAQVETFESFASLTSLNGAGITVNFGATTATMQGSNALSEVRGVNGNGRFAVSGTKYVNCALGDTCTLTFSAPQVAFGFFGTDIGDFNGQLTLRLDGVDLINVPHMVSGPDGTGLYFGIIDTANSFTTIEFLNSGSGDSFGFDSFTIGSIEQIIDVPEPSVIALLTLGLAAMGFKRRSME